MYLSQIGLYFSKCPLHVSRHMVYHDLKRKALMQSIKGRPSKKCSK
jgi:hypothetical protein